MLVDKWNATEYSKNSTAQEKWADELICKLSLVGNESGLDVGCGDGRITSKIGKILTDGSIVGIDLSASMIEMANERYSSKNTSFHEMCATKIRLEKEFDFAFSNATLHWVRDHKSVLSTLRKHLKEGAKILFQMGGRGNASGIVEAFDSVMKRDEWCKYFTNFEFPYTFNDADYYSEILRDSGYLQKRVELIPKVMSHDSINGLKGWLSTTWFPYTERINYERRDEFIDEVLNAYLVKCPTDISGRTFVNMVRLEIEATAL